MENRRLSFCIVCIANYCRSPVFESLFNEKYNDKYEFYSAGLNPMPSANMDPRSIDYLKSLGINKIIHNPKPLNTKILNYFDYILAVDSFVLNQLNLRFKRYSKKFLLVASHLPNIDIIDPYNTTNIEDYNKIMESIKFTVNSINLSKYKKIS